MAGLANTPDGRADSESVAPPPPKLRPVLRARHRGRERDRGRGGWFGYQWFDREILSTLPATLGQATEFRVPCSVQVFDASGDRVDQFYLERRVWVPLTELPEHVWKAFIASEDRRFFEHEGWIRRNPPGARRQSHRRRHEPGRKHDHPADREEPARRKREELPA